MNVIYKRLCEFFRKNLILFILLTRYFTWGEQECNSLFPCQMEDDLLLRWPANHNGLAIVPDGIRHIRPYAFYGCRYITCVCLPQGIKSIDEHAFADCFSLEEISLPTTLVSIGQSIFAGCRNLKSINLPSKVEMVPDLAFWRCIRLSHVRIPTNVTEIGELAFSMCHNLETIHVPGSVRRIASRAFGDCVSLKTVILAEGITNIEESAFSGCKELEKIVLPSSLKKLGNCVFSDCKRLKYVEFLGAVPYVNDFQSVFSIDNEPSGKITKVIWYDAGGGIRLPKITETGRKRFVAPLVLVVPKDEEKRWRWIEKQCNGDNIATNKSPKTVSRRIIVRPALTSRDGLRGL